MDKRVSKGSEFAASAVEALARQYLAERPLSPCWVEAIHRVVEDPTKAGVTAMANFLTWVVIETPTDVPNEIALTVGRLETLAASASDQSVRQLAVAALADNLRWGHWQGAAWRVGPRVASGRMRLVATESYLALTRVLGRTATAKRLSGDINHYVPEARGIIWANRPYGSSSQQAFGSPGEGP